MLRRFSLRELLEMETLRVGQADDLKYEDGDYRVWLSRMTIDDGARCNNLVTVEKIENGEVFIVDEYEAR